MAILDTIKKGYVYFKTSTGYQKFLPRTLASLVTMNDGKNVENAITELNSKSTWEYIGTVAGRTDSLVLPSGWNELKLLLRNNTNFSEFTPTREMFDTSEAVLYLRNGFVYESTGAMYVLEVTQNSVRIQTASTTNIATRVSTDVASATRLYAWYR